MLLSTMCPVHQAVAKGLIQIKDLGILQEWEFVILIPKMVVAFLC